MSEKAWIIAAFMALSFIAGALGQHFYPGVLFPPTELWLMPAFVFLAFYWYWLDAGQRRYRRTPWMNIAIVAIAVLALPYYFVRTRGWARGLAATGLMLCLALLSGLSSMAGEYLVYYGWQA